MIKCIVFDVYGTLISTGTGSVDATKKFLMTKKLIFHLRNFIKYGRKFIVKIQVKL